MLQSLERRVCLENVFLKLQKGVKRKKKKKRLFKEKKSSQFDKTKNTVENGLPMRFHTKVNK